MSAHRYGKASTATDDYIVWDSRTGRVLPAIGIGDVPEECVFSRKSAEETAKSLNLYVLRNALPGLASVMKSVEGPFYARPAAMREQLEGRGIRR